VGTREETTKLLLICTFPYSFNKTTNLSPRPTSSVFGNGQFGSMDRQNVSADESIQFKTRHSLSLLLLFSTYALQPSRLIVRSGLDIPTFAIRRLHACYHARPPSGGRWNCGREMSGNFAYMPTYTLHLRIFYMP